MDIRPDNLSENKNLTKTESINKSESINKTKEQNLNKELLDYSQMLRDRNIEGTAINVTSLKYEEDLGRIERKMPDVYNKPFTGELSRAIGELANDRGKKSEYFLPVAELADKLISQDLDVAQKAQTLSLLLEKAAYYLNNRPGSIFSRQRRKRRTACEKLFSGAVRFLSDAPLDFWFPLKQKVDQLSENSVNGRQNPEARVIKQKLGYFLSDDFVSAAVAKDNLKKLPAGKKSKEVLDVYTKTEGIKALLTNKMPPYPGKKAGSKKLRAFEKEIFETGILISEYYRKLTDSCNKALDIAKLDEMTRKDIAAIRDDALHMGKVFANGIADFLEENNPDSNTTWQEALARKCSVIPQLRDTDVEKMGQGTSIVYKLEKDGETKYFKKDELMAKGPREAWTTVLKDARESRFYKKEYEDRLRKIEAALDKELQSVKEAKTDKEKHDREARFFRDVLYALSNQGEHLLQNAHSLDKKYAEKHPFLKVLQKVKTNSNFGNFMDEVLDEYYKRANSYYLATDCAHIQAGKNLSNRNVATYRMASMLGISRLVVRSDTADVYDGKERIQGMMMAEAQGKEAFIHKQDNELTYSLEAVSELLTMQVFDYICGQIDRNTGNYFLKEKNGELINLQMIDNDMAMGNLMPEDIKGRLQRLLPPDAKIIRALPEDVKNRIKEISRLGVGYLKVFLGDILDTDELKAAQARLDVVAGMILEDEKALKDLVPAPEDVQSLDEQEMVQWREAELSNRPDLKEVYYMYSLYEEVEDNFKAQSIIKDFDDYFEAKSMNFTYLHPNNMMHIDDVKEIIENERKKWDKQHSRK